MKIPSDIDPKELTQHARDEPRQMAYEIKRRQFLAGLGLPVRRSKHNKIKTDSFTE